MTRTSIETNGPFNLVDFGKVLINNGNAYDAATDVMTINVTGYYYIHIQLTTCNTAGVVVKLRVNGTVAFTSNHLMPSSFGGTTRSQAAILALKAGDKFSVVVNSSTHL